MSELSERRWAVMSERGCEATRLDYAEAAGLVRRLRSEKISGLCVITEEAAARLPPARNDAHGPSNDPERQPKVSRPR